VPADPVFLVGTPRGGTTWLQQMLGAHPAIATPQELWLFSHYLAPLETAWREQFPDDVERWRQLRHVGLPAVLTEEAFEEVLRGVAQRVHAEVLSLKPGATVVLEKAPGYGLWADLILRLFPGAGFVHLVRDGRDSVASMVRAARGWGRFWAPASVEGAVMMWRGCVQAARAVADKTDRYVEVRYEELCAEEGPRILGDLFRFCGVETDEAACAAIHSRFSLGSHARESSIVWGGEVARRVRTVELEPEGFSGTGGIGAWRRDLGLRDRLLFESGGGRLLRELGYERDRSWIGSGPVRRFAARVPLALDWRLRRLRRHAASLLGGRA
jgi:hypothetical protein